MLYLYIILIILIVAALLSSIIVLRGHDKWERLLGYTLVSAKVNMLIIVFAMIANRSAYLDVALVYIILSYIGISVLAKYMVERKRRNQ